MEDVFLKDRVGSEIIFVTPLSNSMYRSAHGHGNGLGGPDGYFICATSADDPNSSFEIIAKATSFEAAKKIFLALTRYQDQRVSV